MANIRPGTKSAAAIAVMEKMADKPMDKVIPKIAEAAGLDAGKARHYYVLFVRKGLAPGVVAPRAKAATQKDEKIPHAARVSKKTSKEAKAKAVSRLKQALKKKRAVKKEAEPTATAE